MIKVSHLSKSYKTGLRKTKILNDVSFTLPEKGLFAIFGKSGSGKTTLLNILGGLDKQDEGEFYIDDEKITNSNRDRIRNRKIGFIFQNYYLESNSTIGDILAHQMRIAGFTSEEEIKRRSDIVLSLVDLKKYEKKSSDALSGGQKQRVAIARALIKGSEIILADEPTGNLDSQNTIKVMDILKEISKTKLVVLVTHETSLIHKYADDHIELIDGKLVENTIVEDVKGYQFAKSEQVESFDFQQSDKGKTGKLFSLKDIFSKAQPKESNRLKKVFISIMAIYAVCLGFLLNRAYTTTSVHKSVNQNALYTNLSMYSELPMLDQNDYDSIDFFELNMREAIFSFENISSIKGVNEKYAPKPLEETTTFSSLYGNMPFSNQVLITRGLAKQIKHDLRNEDLSKDDGLLLMKFDDEYSISGIVEEDDLAVYFNKQDYVNYLGIYNDLKIVDNENIFLKSNYASMTYSATIQVYEGKKELKNNQTIIDISRNSLYKMMEDTSQGDYYVEEANKKLVELTTAIYIENSEMYVKSFNITRESISTDLVIYVTKEAMKNLFIYLTPNLETLGNDTSTTYYFEITTSKEEQLQNLKERFKKRGVNTIDISSLYRKEDEETLKKNLQIVYFFLLGALLLYLIYYFMEMSDSTKNSKEYGIYRAIGVNKSNLLFKEMMRSLSKNVTVMALMMFLSTTLCSIYFIICNSSILLFLLFSLGLFVAGSLLMILVSLIPYLFVVYKMPSEIIARYDL